MLGIVLRIFRVLIYFNLYNFWCRYYNILLNLRFFRLKDGLLVFVFLRKKCSFDVLRIVGGVFISEILK